MERLLILSALVLASVLEIQGKVLNLGGAWNRPFRARKDYTDIEYVRDLAWKVGNITEEKGLNFVPQDYTFQVSETFLGVNLVGDVTFEKGVVSSSGGIVPSIYMPWSNRTEDLSVATIYLAVRLHSLETLHTFTTKLAASNAQGSVETLMKDVDFFFVLQHKFKSGVNTVELGDVSFSELPEWSIKPRNLVTYAIEQTTKRNSETRLWYEGGLVAWQKDVLAPLLVQGAQDLPFPISPN